MESTSRERQKGRETGKGKENGSGPRSKRVRTWDTYSKGKLNTAARNLLFGPLIMLKTEHFECSTITK